MIAWIKVGYHLFLVEVNLLQKEFNTILNSAAAEIEEKKSRFIASIKPVADEEDAINFINEIKARNWDASHNVYAYYIVGDNVIQRFSDDGEPTGTAGMPVLEVIKRRKLQNVVIVITRYFGGTLLGAAGLIRAYGKCASCGIDCAKVVTKQLCTEVSIKIEYTLWGKLQSLLISNGYTIKKIIYEQDVEVILYIPVDDIEKFLSFVVEETNARAKTKIGEKTYIILDETGKLVLESED
jgi:uncharacterized YigZ family protein